MEHYSDIKKKNEILPFVATWMELDGIIISEISQREKDKYCILSFICVIEKNKTIRCMEQTRNRLTVTENKLIVTKGVRERRKGKILAWD